MAEDDKKDDDKKDNGERFVRKMEYFKEKVKKSSKPGKKEGQQEQNKGKK